jgi:hypothetical protein
MKIERGDGVVRDRGLLEILPAVGVLLAYGLVCLVGGAKLCRLDAA